MIIPSRIPGAPQYLITPEAEDEIEQSKGGATLMLPLQPRILIRTANKHRKRVTK